MNLFDIHKKEWDDSLLQACGSNLSNKLGTTVPSNSILGDIDNYFVKRFGFNKNCKVIAFTGDNPGSLIGMCLGENDIAISLGTSDTLFMWLEKPKILLDGHILCNPIDKNAFMALLCFKNGSLSRNRIRDKCAESSWDTFNELLNSTPRGNFGNMGFYYDQREIIPWAIGDHLFNKANDRILKFNSKEVEVRALIEGQFIAKRAHAEDMGYVLGPNTRIIATGGGSTNKAILQVISDVFNSPVYCIDAKNSAMLGSAYQAKHGLFSNSASFKEITKSVPQPQVICTPYSDANAIYNPMVERYRKLIKTIS